MLLMNKDYLEIKLQSIDDKAKLSASSRENPELIVDYFPPIGTGQGYTSLELLLISFASCISTTLVALLRAKMKKNVSGITAIAKGAVKEEHPKALSHIQLALTIQSDDITEADVKQALAVSEEKLCPVWAMIKGNVTIDVSFAIHKSELQK